MTGGIDALREAVEGDVYSAGDAGYEEARRVWNAQIDRRPAAIVTCETPADVVAAIAYARQEGLDVSVRGGAHSTSGSAVAEGGLMIDLSRMSRVTVDLATHRARAGGGALLADLDAATQQHGLATTGGLISHTGVGGLTLGGGMGWLTRRHGLTIDNLTGAEVVLADGRVVWASADEHPDLFWALRGGGGNFGVVTTFELQLHPVGPLVHMGFLFYGADQAVEALRMMRDTVPKLPRSMNALIVGLNSPPAPFVPPEHHFAPGFAIVLVGFGAPEEHGQHAESIRTTLPPRWEFVTPMPYTALQQMQDEATAWGQLVYEKGLQLVELTDEVIAILADRLLRRTSPLSMLAAYRLDEAYSDVPEDATAYGGGRSPRYALTINGIAHDLETWEKDRDWVRGLWDALQPYAPSTGDYINFMTDLDEDRVAAAYGPAKFARLRQVKAVYDPDNVFHSNANIPPATS